LVARAWGLRAGTDLRVDAKVVPDGVKTLIKTLGIRGSLDSRRADQAGEGAGGISAAGESENVDFIAALVVCRDRMIGILDDLL
jgi:hypothetical protein